MLTASDDPTTDENDSARVYSGHSDDKAEALSKAISTCDPEEPHEEQIEEAAGPPDQSETMDVVVTSSEEQHVDILTSIAETDDDSDDEDAALIKQYRLKECIVRLEELPPEAGESNHDTQIRSLLEQIQIFGSDSDASGDDEATTPRPTPPSKPVSIAMHRICAHCPKSTFDLYTKAKEDLLSN